MTLTSQQVAGYVEHGYLIHGRPVFSTQCFAELTNEFEQLLNTWPSDRRPEAIDVPHYTVPQLLKWALAADILDLVEEVVGPDIVLFSTHFICKPPGDGRRVPWHEDSYYWRNKLSPMEVCTVWLAIDESTVENGCMHVVPGSHRSGRCGFSDYGEVDSTLNVFDQEILPAQLGEQPAVPIELKPNHCSLHDARLIHGSPPNRSNRRRCGWTLRYCPAHARLNPEFSDVHLMYQARGGNLCGQPLADPNKSYPAVVRKRELTGRKSH